MRGTKGNISVPIDRGNNIFSMKLGLTKSKWTRLTKKNRKKCSSLYDRECPKMHAVNPIGRIGRKSLRTALFVLRV
jgi:hypothetical protein